MTPDDIRHFLDSAPAHRRLLYEVAFCSGLRRGELRALTVDHLDLKRNGLLLEADWTKNRQDGFQPLPITLCERLVDYAQTGEAHALYQRHYRRKDAASDIPEKPLLFVPLHTARSVDEDLQAAGIDKRAFGGKLDFHAIRTAYVNLLFQSGADVKTAQVAARHASADMTLNVYGRTREDALTELAEAVGETVLKAPDGQTENGTVTEQQAVGFVSPFVSESSKNKAAGSNPGSATLRLRHLILGQPEPAGNRHLVLWVLLGLAVLLARIPAHQERPRRDMNHLREHMPPELCR